MIESLERVFTRLESTDKYDAIDEVIFKCSIFDELEDKEKFIRAVHRRERLQSTGIGHGVAIAHGKLHHLDKCHIALGYSELGIVFDEHYPEPVQLVFVIASCQSRQGEYIHAVSNILSWVHDSSFREDLREGRMTDQVVTFLSYLANQTFIARPI